MKFTINNTGKKTIPVIIQGVERQVRGCSSRDFTVKTSKSSYKVTLYRDTVTVRDGDERDFWVGENPNVLSVGRYGAITGERLQRGEPSPNNTDYSCY